MEAIQLKPSFKDERGVILDILSNEPIEHVTVITSLEGVVRGNHFHKNTIQWVYVHSGLLKSLTQKEGEKVIAIMLSPGDLLRTDKMEKHAIHALQDSVFFVFTKGPRGGTGYEKDTFRLDRPLNEEIHG